jgi:hypothetical protein
MRYIAGLFAIAALLVCACGPVPAHGDIKDANDAAASGATPEATRETDFGGFSGPVYTYELRPGDCFEADESLRTLNQVIRVTCDRFHDYQVLNVLLLEGDDWPGEDYIEQKGVRDCDPAMTDLIYPSADTWFIGDRTIVCLRDTSSVPLGPQG